MCHLSLFLAVSLAISPQSLALHHCYASRRKWIAEAAGVAAGVGGGAASSFAVDVKRDGEIDDAARLRMTKNAGTVDVKSVELTVLDSRIQFAEYNKSGIVDMKNSRRRRKGSLCKCTTVKCPEEGRNHVIMGNGSAILDYVYTSHQDHEVVVSAQGIITPSALDHGSGTTSCTQKYSRILEDDGDHDCDAGHILAQRLGGYGNLPMNIFPQNAGVNRGVFAQFEGIIYDHLHAGNAKEATLHWDFFYKSDTHTMPFLVNYSAVFDDGYALQSMFRNE